jgi:hypothetical protein
MLVGALGRAVNATYLAVNGTVGSHCRAGRIQPMLAMGLENDYLRFPALLSRPPWFIPTPEKIFIAHGLSDALQGSLNGVRLGLLAQFKFGFAGAIRPGSESIYPGRAAGINCFLPGSCPEKGWPLIDGGVSVVCQSDGAGDRATEIFALDLFDGREALVELPGMGQLIGNW